ncbi:hypothetical protein FN846DRAFT_912471 [Sphaerosporella brunnea]|uniref:SWIM-type domain-containing protein n=1 Tax=Sphaerosporella brunnea TaxID=1250544 RepID=A0A5J5EHU2_9PEZI|nr:hypothetical protein FN846DRAFT_912471 [Sphaerosporella brunnea]
MGRAKRADSDIVYIVDFENRTCTCLRFQDTDIPCGHAVALIRRLKQAPSDYMPSYVKNRTLINSNSEDFPPFDIGDLRSIKQRMLVDSEDNSDTDSDASTELSEPPLDECEPPVTRATRGRPPKKRVPGAGQHLSDIQTFLTPARTYQDFRIIGPTWHTFWDPV